ncbi:MAG: hypothetical protein ACM31D_09065 [Bacteroidota bacterium]
MRKFAAALATILFTSLTAWAGSPIATPSEAARKFVEAITQRKYLEAINSIPELKEKQTDIDQFSSKLDKFIEVYGGVDHFDLIREESGGTSLLRQKYVIFYKKGFGVIEFRFFRHQDGWHLSSVDYNFGENGQEALWK